MRRRRCTFSEERKTTAYSAGSLMERIRERLAFEDANTVAFLDRRPVFGGHYLLTPKERVVDMSGASDGLLGRMFASANAVAQAVEKAMDADGTFVAVNNRVSQSVAHLHIPIVPRKQKDGPRGFFWPMTRYASDGELWSVRDRIRKETRSVKK